MEKIARRNIMAIYRDWRIFRRILKHDLALDRMSGQRRMALSGRRCGQLACSSAATRDVGEGRRVMTTRQRRGASAKDVGKGR